MIPVMWKEIRENAKWAVLWLIGIGLVMTYVLATENRQYAFEEPEGLLSSQFIMVTVFGSAIAGALLGLLQIIPELMRDQWSFLLHRPSERSRLFWGKVLGGITLYLLAMGLPLLAAALWVSRPGNMAAPFDWRMVLPGVADLLAGVMMYFAGLLAALRPARWYASRALPIAVAGGAISLVIVVSEFWQALLVVGIACVLLGLAARGAFISSGEYQPQSRPAKIALGITLLVGIFVAGSVLAAMLAIISGIRHYDYSRYFLDKNGKVLIAQTAATSEISVTDMQSQPVEEFKDPEKAAMYYQYSLSLSGILGEWKWWENYRSSTRFRIRTEYDNQESWYFVRKANRFQGFRFHDKRAIGWLGANGYSANMDHTEPLHCSQLPSIYYASYATSTLLSSPEGLFRANWSSRSMETIYQSPSDNPVRGGGTVDTWSGEIKKTVATAIATTKGIVLLHSGDTRFASLPYHYDISQYGEIQMGAVWPGDRLFIWYSPSSDLGSRAKKMPSYIVEVTPTGEERARITLPPLPALLATPRWYDRFVLGLVPLAVYIIAAVTLLVSKFSGHELEEINWLTRFEQIVESLINDEINWLSRFEQMVQNPINVTIGIVTFLVLTAVAALMTRRMTQRYAFSTSGRRFWTTAAIFFGPAALLTLLGLHQWPALVPCPTCKSRRRVDRTHCNNCGQLFPPQNVRPGDIFDAQSPQGSNETAHPAIGVTSA